MNEKKAREAREAKAARVVKQARLAREARAARDEKAATLARATETVHTEKVARAAEAAQGIPLEWHQAGKEWKARTTAGPGTWKQYVIYWQNPEGYLARFQFESIAPVNYKTLTEAQAACEYHRATGQWEPTDRATGPLSGETAQTPEPALEWHQSDNRGAWLQGFTKDVPPDVYRVHWWYDQWTVEYISMRWTQGRQQKKVFPKFTAITVVKAACGYHCATGTWE